MFTISKPALFSLRRTATLMGIFGLLALTGCQTLEYQGPTEAIPVDAMRRPVDLSVVCVMPNEAVSSKPLLQALSTGVTRFGSVPKYLVKGEGPQACSFVLAYGVGTDQRAITEIRYQTFENSIPGINATGRAPQGGALTVDNVAAYTVQLLTQAKRRLGERAIGPEKKAGEVPASAEK